MSRYNDFFNLVQNMEQDVEKFYKGGNAAAGTRVRKTLQDIKELAHEVRKEIQDMKNSMKEKE